MFCAFSFTSGRASPHAADTVPDQQARQPDQQPRQEGHGASTFRHNSASPFCDTSEGADAGTVRGLTGSHDLLGGEQRQTATASRSANHLPRTTFSCHRHVLWIQCGPSDRTRRTQGGKDSPRPF